MKNRNLVIVILAVICAGLLAGVVYTVTKGKSGTQKKQEASAERNGITVRNHRRRRKEIQTQPGYQDRSVHGC